MRDGTQRLSGLALRPGIAFAGRDRCHELLRRHRLPGDTPRASTAWTTLTQIALVRGGARAEST